MPGGVVKSMENGKHRSCMRAFISYCFDNIVTRRPLRNVERNAGSIPSDGHGVDLLDGLSQNIEHEKFSSSSGDAGNGRILG